MKGEIPIACSLDGQTQESRGDEWRRLLGPHLIKRAPIPGGVRLILRNVPGAADELDRLIALEQGCCSWINWTVEKGQHLQVDATANQEQGAKQLEAWYLRS